MINNNVFPRRRQTKNYDGIITLYKEFIFRTPHMYRTLYTVRMYLAVTLADERVATVERWIGNFRGKKYPAPPRNL